MTSYEIYCKERDSKGFKDSEVAQGTGIGKSTFSDWKSGRSTPKGDKLQKIANFLNISYQYLTTGKESEKESMTGEKYYFDDETAQMAQSLFEQKDLRMLFDAAQDCKPEDLKMAADLLKRLKETNADG